MTALSRTAREQIVLSQHENPATGGWVISFEFGPAAVQELPPRVLDEFQRAMAAEVSLSMRLQVLAGFVKAIERQSESKA